MRNSPDAELLAGLIAEVAESRSRRAFVSLFEYFAPRIKAYLMRLGSPESQAEDLVQDVMLTVWRRAELYDRSMAGPGTWIFTIARNRRIDVLRRERRPEIDPDDPALVPAAEPDPDSVAEVGQREGRIRLAIERLPAEQAELVHLSFFGELSHAEISARLDLPLGTVKSRIRLAIGKLKASLEELGS